MTKGIRPRHKIHVISSHLERPAAPLASPWSTCHVAADEEGTRRGAGIDLLLVFTHHV